MKARIHKIIAILIAAIFSYESSFGSQLAQAQMVAPVQPTMMLQAEHQSFAPVMIRGMRIDPQNGFHLNFIVDSGDANLQGEDLKKESEKLIKYFLTSLSVPEDELWVNLSPFEKDRITSKALTQTEMGRDLLAQDYILKRLTASLLNPDEAAGKEFWNKIYEKTYEVLGKAELPADTFHKIWIVPSKIEVFAQGDTVLILDSKMNVMLEEDYLAKQEAAKLSGLGAVAGSDQMSDDVKEALRSVILPVIEEEVNHGKNFANLRQIYHALIMAKWFKDHLKQSILGQVFVDQKKLEGLNTSTQEALNAIYNGYLQAFKSGSEGYIREEYDPSTQNMAAKKYVTGGVFLKAVSEAMLSGSDIFRALEAWARVGPLNYIGVQFQPVSNIMMSKLTIPGLLFFGVFTLSVLVGCQNDGSLKRNPLVATQQQIEPTTPNVPRITIPEPKLLKLSENFILVGYSHGPRHFYVGMHDVFMKTLQRSISLQDGINYFKALLQGNPDLAAHFIEVRKLIKSQLKQGDAIGFESNSMSNAPLADAKILFELLKRVGVFTDDEIFVLIAMYADLSVAVFLMDNPEDILPMEEGASYDKLYLENELGQKAQDFVSRYPEFTGVMNDVIGYINDVDDQIPPNKQEEYLRRVHNQDAKQGLRDFFSLLEKVVQESIVPRNKAAVKNARHYLKTKSGAKRILYPVGSGHSPGIKRIWSGGDRAMMTPSLGDDPLKQKIDEWADTDVENFGYVVLYNNDQLVSSAVGNELTAREVETYLTEERGFVEVYPDGVQDPTGFTKFLAPGDKAMMAKSKDFKDMSVEQLEEARRGVWALVTSIEKHLKELKQSLKRAEEAGQIDSVNDLKGKIRENNNKIATAREKQGLLSDWIRRKKSKLLMILLLVSAVLFWGSHSFSFNAISSHRPTLEDNRLRRLEIFKKYDQRLADFANELMERARRPEAPSSVSREEILKELGERDVLISQENYVFVLDLQAMYRQSFHQGNGDSGSVSNNAQLNGGIDLGSKDVEFTSSGTVDPAMMNQMLNINSNDVVGVTIGHITITPIPNVRVLLGLDTNSDDGSQEISFKDKPQDIRKNISS